MVSKILELSNNIQDEADWAFGQLREFDIPLNITALALEPTTKLLAIGTTTGAIYIHGGPGVDVKLRTPASVGVKLLHFASLSQHFLCLDDKNALHIWDLAAFGAPEYLSSVQYRQVTSLALSPSLCHVFVGLQSGELHTYDLACLRKSVYTTPNMWTTYKQNTAVKGVPSLVPQSDSQPCIDLQLHPRNLNQIFVAYPGGVILSDLTERSTIRAYELILPPGAQGGFGYGMDDLLTHRQPEVTCLSIHPSGHFFAVGHADGTIAFWAVIDDTKPLLVRTLDDKDVDQVDTARLEHELQKNQEGCGSVVIREPVFKLAWSSFSDSIDPRGGQTTLTLLGGLDSRHGGSVSVLLFSAFHPADPPTDNAIDPLTLHPSFRLAMVESLTPINAFAYEGEGEIQDFLLCPREHGHFGGNHDPYALIYLQTTPGGGRVIEAYRFPPRDWIYPKEVKNPMEFPAPLVDDHEDQPEFPRLDLSSLVMEDETEELDLPFHLIHGSALLKGGHLLTSETHAYEGMIGANKAIIPEMLQLDGGLAFSDPTKAAEMRFIKHEPHRILITYDSHGRIRFFDFSSQFLANDAPQPEPLKSHFPNPLFGLTLDLRRYHSILTTPEQSGPPRVTVQCLSFAPEALEMAVALDNGDVVVCHPSTSEGVSTAQSFNATQDKDIVMINTLPGTNNSAISPYFIVKGNTPVQACSMSNIGFLAISYRNGRVAVVDMRVPHVLRRFGTPSKHTRTTSSIGHRLSSGIDIATALTWSITPMEKDPNLRVRLLVSRASGTVEIYSLTNTRTWEISPDPDVVSKGVVDPLANGTFVLDAKSGTSRGSNRALFATVVKGSFGRPEASIFLTVGAKGARSSCNVDGERLGKVEWGPKHGTVIAAQVVKHLSSKALVVVTDRHVGLTYSIPSLEEITTFNVPDSPFFTIDQSGDFVSFSSSSGKELDRITYGTFFDIRRVRTPAEVSFALKMSNVPQPQPVSIGPASLLGSWFALGQSPSGKQIDNLLGGPDRPIIVKAPLIVPGTMTASATNAAASIAASAAAAQASIFSKLSSAMNERGQLLDDLGERFSALEAGSRNAVAQAKRAAAQQTAKSWFGF